MRLEHLRYLCSPKTHRQLELSDPTIEAGRVRKGLLSDGVDSWPISEFIPRFVQDPDCLDSFSFQWNRHPSIMNEYYSGLTLYKERFSKETRWPMKMPGQTILEAGCGVGTFTRCALDTDALVISFDVSTSVDTLYEQLGTNPRLLIVQASIYEMPFLPIFDNVFCFGVLQHTPDPQSAFQQLVSRLRAGGRIASDIYADIPLTRHHGLLKTKYFLRRWTAGKSPEKIHKWVSGYVSLVWPVCRAMQRVRGGLVVSQHLMIDKYEDRLTGMRPEMFKEYAIIEIFDMLSPAHDFPQRLEVFKQWHEEAGLGEIDVQYGYNGIEARARKPATV